MGRPYEEAIAFHRALGHLMMALYTFHAVGYMWYWLARGWAVFADEMTDWLHCGECTHINNLAGVISWGGGLLLWMTSLKWFRRRNYAVFFTAHQLHIVFFMFGCIHWPTCARMFPPMHQSRVLCYLSHGALATALSFCPCQACVMLPRASSSTWRTSLSARTSHAPLFRSWRACVRRPRHRVSPHSSSHDQAILQGP